MRRILAFARALRRSSRLRVLAISTSAGKVEGHFAANDDFFPPDACEALAADLRSQGKDVVFHVYPGTGHGFTNEEDPLGSYDQDATAQAWGRTLDLLNTVS